MINKEKKLKSTLLLLVLIVLILFGIVISFHQYSLIKNDIKNDIKVQNNYIHQTYTLFLDKLKVDISKKSDFMIKTSGVKEAFNNKNREKLYKLIQKPYNRIVAHNNHVKIITFRLIDGSTFLRVHKPQMFGDKLNKKRKIILDTISTQKRQYGFEVGKLKMTYRVVTPIFYNNKLIGVVEIGIEPESITKNIDKLFDIQTALLIKKEHKDISIDKSKMKRIDNFLIARGDKLFLNNLNQIDLSKETNQVTYKEMSYMINTTLNLNDNKNNIAAKILVAFSMKEYTEKLNQLIKLNIPITVILLVILFIILNVGLNNYLKKIEKLHEDILEKDTIMAQHSKMAAMGEMIESIAHQWRQPLSIITTSVSGIKIKKHLGVLDDDSFDHFYNTIINNAQHLSSTIDDFKNFFKKDKIKTEFNLKDTFHYSFNLLSSKFRTVKIELIENIDDVKMYGFANELTQVIMNILNNARDELETKEYKRIIFIDIYTKNNNAIIEIKDNAGGIPTEVLPKVFDAHFTTKEETNGTGIGLYMSKKIIINSFNGDITAQNTTYKYDEETYSGALFTVILPIS